MSGKRKEVKMAKPDEVNVPAGQLWKFISPEFTEAGKWSAAVDLSASH